MVLFRESMPFCLFISTPMMTLSTPNIFARKQQPPMISCGRSSMVRSSPVMYGSHSAPLMMTVSTWPMPPEILTWVGNVAPPMPTIPAFLTISIISSTLRRSGSAGATTSSLISSWKSLSMMTDMMLPPIEYGRGSTATTVPDTDAWIGAPRPLKSPIFWPILT